MERVGAEHRRHLLDRAIVAIISSRVDMSIP